jgi:hypothetical protein
MNPLLAELAELASSISRSQWAELGVDSAPRRLESRAIDLEPLIIFSARLGLHDRRLRASSLDWCIANTRFVSAIRLGRLLNQAPDSMREAFGDFAATVHTHTGVRWPGAGEAFVRLPTVREVKPDLRRPALLQLRLRAIVGVSARAEVLRILLSNPERPRPTSTLADIAAYSKGSVSQALDMLTASGIVQVQPAANRLVYRLEKPRDLMQLLEWGPGSVPDWWAIFRIIDAFDAYARSKRSEPGAAFAGAEAVSKRIRPDLRRLEIATQAPHLEDKESIPAFETWVLTRIGDYANPTNVAPQLREVAYTIHRLPYGGWIGSINERGREPCRLGLIERSGDRDLGALELTRCMFRDALENAPGVEWPSEAIIAVVSREFAEDLLRPMRSGQDATFSAEFVRRWIQSRRRNRRASA